MIAREVEVDGIRGRVFSRESCEPDASALEGAFDLEENRERLRALEELIRAPVVSACLFPTIGTTDVLEAFLAPSGTASPGIFLCSIVTPPHVRALLGSTPIVVEGPDLQVTETERLTEDGVRAAVQAWIERVVPEATLPRIELVPWTAPDGVPSSVLGMLLSPPPARSMNPLVDSEASPSEQIEVGEIDARGLWRCGRRHRTWM